MRLLKKIIVTSFAVVSVMFVLLLIWSFVRFRIDDAISYSADCMVTSHLMNDVTLLTVDGMDGREPGGFISKNLGSACFRLPRMYELPKEITVHWKSIATEEEFEQVVPYPRIPMGIEGTVVWELLPNNQWSLFFVPGPMVVSADQAREQLEQFEQENNKK